MRLYPTFLLLAGCAGIPSAGSPISGQWGGLHIDLTLGPRGGHIAYDCASGTIGPVVLDADGRFTVAGTHTPGHGGPAREGEILPGHSARFSGIVKGSRMMLEGRVDNGVELGPFSLEKGAAGEIFRCL